MIALIDGDIITHRVGFTTENDPSDIAKIRCDDMLDSILLETDASEYQIYLSDSKENNFRYKIDPSYKANRVAPKPKHYDYLKEYLITNWEAKISYGMEADDSLGINQKQIPIPILESPTMLYKYETVICSIDKDLLTIPGLHYNFVKKEFIEVIEKEASLRFYRSILTGDVADNIKGVYGIGPKKAEKILSNYTDEQTMLSLICDIYFKATPEIDPIEVIQTIRRNGQLLKIRQEEDEPLWNSLFLKQMEEQIFLSTPQRAGELNQSTEPIIPEIPVLDG